jgi:hypothetical protein
MELLFFGIIGVLQVKRVEKLSCQPNLSLWMQQQTVLLSIPRLILFFFSFFLFFFFSFFFFSFFFQPPSQFWYFVQPWYSYPMIAVM